MAARVAKLEEATKDADWHRVGDGAFARPFGTVRQCTECGALVGGGPSRCVRCAQSQPTFEQLVAKVGPPASGQLASAGEVREGRTHLHRLKVWPPFFDDIIAGRKSFEIRKNDRDFKAGDEWIADEYAPGVGLTGRRSSPFTITYVTPPSACIPAGYCGFQFEKSRRVQKEEPEPAAPDAGDTGGGK
jgi:hypothetical protein